MKFSKEQKRDILQLASEIGKVKAAKAYKISARTIFNWQHEKESLPPHKNLLSKEVVDSIIAYKKNNLEASLNQIKDALYLSCSRTTIAKYLKDNGLLKIVSASSSKIANEPWTKFRLSVERISSSCKTDNCYLFSLTELTYNISFQGISNIFNQQIELVFLTTILEKLSDFSLDLTNITIYLDLKLVKCRYFKQQILTKYPNLQPFSIKELSEQKVSIAGQTDLNQVLKEYLQEDLTIILVRNIFKNFLSLKSFKKIDNYPFISDLIMQMPLFSLAEKEISQVNSYLLTMRRQKVSWSLGTKANNEADSVFHLLNFCGHEFSMRAKYEMANDFFTILHNHYLPEYSIWGAISLADCCVKQNQFQQAQKMVKPLIPQALEAAKKGSVHNYFDILDILGEVVIVEGKWHRALKLYRDQAKYISQDNYYHLYRNMDSLGMTYRVLGLLDKSANIFMEALKGCEQRKYLRGITAFQLQLANVYSDRGDYLLAIELLKGNLKMAKEVHFEIYARYVRSLIMCCAMSGEFLLGDHYVDLLQQDIMPFYDPKTIFYFELVEIIAFLHLRSEKNPAFLSCMNEFNEYKAGKGNKINKLLSTDFYLLYGEFLGAVGNFAQADKAVNQCYKWVNKSRQAIYHAQVILLEIRLLLKEQKYSNAQITCEKLLKLCAEKKLVNVMKVVRVLLSVIEIKIGVLERFASKDRSGLTKLSHQFSDLIALLSKNQMQKRYDINLTLYFLSLDIYGKDGTWPLKLQKRLELIIESKTSVTADYAEHLRKQALKNQGILIWQNLIF